MNSRKFPTKNLGTVYTFEEFSHLIKHHPPQKLIFKDSLEFLYALNQAKYEFNTTYQSDFLKTYSKKQNDYRSRRDELGGHISSEDWKRFIQHLEEIIKITKIRRRNRRLRRKKRGKTVNIYKGPNVAKSRLWRNVFIKPFNHESSKREKYLREVNKIDSNQKDILIQPFAQIINDSIKVPIPPSYPKQKAKTRVYSPGRHRTFQK